MNVIEYDLSGIKPQKNNRSKSLKYIKHLHKIIKDLETKLAEIEKKHLLDEKEWQDYCAFKHIEPQIKGCLDREREYEKQLAEKERDFDLLMLSKNEEINEWIAVRDDKNKVIDRQTDKIQELKQQLAEKEKEIEELEYNFDCYKNELTRLNKNWNNSRIQQRRLYYNLKENQNQDKIKFTITELEKVKGLTSNNYIIHGWLPENELKEQIDKQIKSLKEMIKSE